MTLTLAQSGAAPQGVFFVSIYKPILFFLIMVGWAWVISKFDKDTATHFLPRRLWNLLQIGVGTLAFLLWLVIPVYWVGLPLAVILLSGGILGYIIFRNGRVPEKARWRLSADMLTSRMDSAKAAQAQRRALLRMMTSRGEKLPVPVGEDPFTDAHSKLEEILEYALPRNAERIDFVVAGTQQVAVAVHIDGAKFPQQGIDVKAAVAVIDYLKTHAKLDVADRRRRQSGTVHFEAGEMGKHTLGVQTAGSTRELTLYARIDPSQRFNIGIDKLGLLEAQRQQLDTVLKDAGRVVLAACPPGQGQTTTLYSLMHHHDPYMQSVVTLEDEIAIECEGVHHNVLEPGTDADALSQRVARLLREDHQVIMLSRLSDVQTAKAIARGAREVRFYVGMRQDDTFGALRTWIKAVGDPKQAADGLAAIVAQRLVRKLCPTCRMAYKPDPEALRKLNLPADKVAQLFKHSGQVLLRKNKPEACPDCLGMAYRGRVGVFEVMVLDDTARQFIAASKLDQLRAHLRKQKMLWLQEAALARVVDGSTSISEVTRVLEKDKESAKAQPAQTL